MRIGRDQLFMEISHSVAKRSTCFRLNVGAVVVVNRRIVSMGYNGPPAGEAHCTGHHCAPVGAGCVRSIHAEVNALQRLPAGVLHDAKTLYVTDSPCAHCFEYLTKPFFRVTALYYGNLYRLHDHLHNSPIPIFRLTPSGYVIDHATGEVVEGP